MILYLECRSYGIALDIPTTRDEAASTIFSLIAGFEDEPVEISISGVNSPIPSLYPYVQHADLESWADIEKLNTLDARINGMTQEEQRRREEAPVQEETPKAMLLTLTVSEQSYPLVLPASEKQLGQAKESLRIEDFAQAVIANAEYTAPYLNQLIPMDNITVEDANEMALCLQRLKKDGEIMKYCAALEVEEPSTFTEALDMVIDIDDYELISDSEREYGRQALRRMGASDEVLEAIEGCTDFDRLGSEMMDEDGVRQTGFGLVRRLSKPFPPAQEPDQQMGGLSC